MQNNNDTTSTNNMLMYAGVQHKKRDIHFFSTFKEFTFQLFSNLKIPLYFFQDFHVHDICARSRSLLHVLFSFFFYV